MRQVHFTVNEDDWRVFAEYSEVLHRRNPTAQLRYMIDEIVKKERVNLDILRKERARWSVSPAAEKAFGFNLQKKEMTKEDDKKAFGDTGKAPLLSPR